MITFLALVAVAQAFMAMCLATASYNASIKTLAVVQRDAGPSSSDLLWANLMDTVNAGYDDAALFRSKRNHPASGNF